MSWLKSKSGDFSNYSVTLSSTNRSESVLLGNKKGKRILSGTMNKIASLVAVFMVMAVAFSGVLSSASSAKADAFGVEEGVTSLFCSGGAQGLKVYDLGIRKPNTGNGVNQSWATPYEKYGMSGTNWSSWIGFSPYATEPKSVSANDNAGAFSSAGVITATGDVSDKTDLSQWEAQTQGEDGEKEKNTPGLWNLENECSSFSGRYFLNSVANGMLESSKLTTYLSGLVYQTAAEVSSGIYTMMEKPISSIVTTLKDKLYFNYLIPMIMLAALWMAYVGLFKRETTNFLSGLVWLILAMAVSVVFMTKPMLMPESLSGLVGSVSQGSMAAITSAQSSGDGMCAVATKGGKKDSSVKGNGKNETENGGDKFNTKTRNSIREVQCNLWYAFVYTPWVTGQFGETPSQLVDNDKGRGENSFKSIAAAKGSTIYQGKGYKLLALKSTSGKRLGVQNVTFGSKNNNAGAKNAEQSWALFLLDHKVNWEDSKNPKTKLNKIRDQLSVYGNQLGEPDYNADFRGDNGGNRVALGAISALGSLGAGIMIVVISITIIILDLGIVVMAIISPVFFLAALHPGTGRKIAMGWVETVLKMAMRRIAMSIFLAVMIAIFAVIVEQTQDFAWILSMILIVAVSIGGLMYKKQISEMFNNFSLGGQAMQQQGLPGANGARNAGRGLWSGLKGNSLAAVSGGRLGRNSTLGNMKQEDRADKRWEKNMGGAGATPNRKGGDGENPLSRKETKKQNQSAAARRIMQREGHLPEESEASQQSVGPDGSGAGNAPMEQPIENSHEENAALHRPEYDNDGNEIEGSGAGNAPATQDLNSANEANHQGLDAPRANEANPNEIRSSGAGNAPHSVTSAPSQRSWAEIKRTQDLQRIANVKRKSTPLNRFAGNRKQQLIAAKNSMQEKRANNAYDKQRREMIDKNVRAGLPMPKTAEVQQAINAKRAAAQDRNKKLLAPVTGVKSIGAKTSGAVRAGFVEPAKELGNMTRSFNEDTNNRFNVAPHVSPRISQVRDAQLEKKAMKTVMNREVGAMKAEVKQENREIRTEQKTRKQDIKTMPRGVMREVYASEKYGADKKGRLATPEKKPTMVGTAPAPRQVSAPPTRQQSAPTAAPRQVNTPPTRQQSAPRPAAPQAVPPRQAPQKAPEAPRPAAPQVTPRQPSAPRQAPPKAPPAPQAVPPRQAPPKAPPAAKPPKAPITRQNGDKPNPPSRRDPKGNNGGNPRKGN